MNICALLLFLGAADASAICRDSNCAVLEDTTALLQHSSQLKPSKQRKADTELESTSDLYPYPMYTVAGQSETSEPENAQVWPGQAPGQSLESASVHEDLPGAGPETYQRVMTQADLDANDLTGYSPADVDYLGEPEARPTAMSEGQQQYSSQMSVPIESDQSMDGGAQFEPMVASEHPYQRQSRLGSPVGQSLQEESGGEQTMAHMDLQSLDKMLLDLEPHQERPQALHVDTKPAASPPIPAVDLDSLQQTLSSAPVGRDNFDKILQSLGPSVDTQQLDANHILSQGLTNAAPSAGSDSGSEVLDKFTQPPALQQDLLSGVPSADARSLNNLESLDIFLRSNGLGRIAPLRPESV